jgi:hypothetical protein
MSHVLSLVALFGLMLCMLPSHRTMAQQLSESGVVYEAARNKLGLIRYCRRNNLLDPTLADQVVTAVETGLRERPPGDSFATEQGDIAQQAGEDGFWDAGRRRDIAGVASLFGTTPADLCRDWADETLRAQAPRPCCRSSRNRQKRNWRSRRWWSQNGRSPNRRRDRPSAKLRWCGRPVPLRPQP